MFLPKCRLLHSIEDQLPAIQEIPKELMDRAVEIDLFNGLSRVGDPFGRRDVEIFPHDHTSHGFELARLEVVVLRDGARGVGCEEEGVEDRCYEAVGGEHV